jgi:hypothetical protein
MPNTHYVGKAGQFAVMAELAFRGYNVAIPEIDVGDDVFVLNDQNVQLTRIQVKTSTGRKQPRDGSYRCQFLIKLAHVHAAAMYAVHYVLAGRCGKRWRFLVLDRAVLSELISSGWGTQATRGTHMLSVVFIDSDQARTSTRDDATDLSRHLGNWRAWPLVTRP